MNRSELEYKFPEGRGFVWIAQSCFPGLERRRLCLLPLFPFLSAEDARRGVGGGAGRLQAWRGWDAREEGSLPSPWSHPRTGGSAGASSAAHW